MLSRDIEIVLRQNDEHADSLATEIVERMEFIMNELGVVDI